MTHVYDGTFPLDLLTDDERVTAAGDESGACLVHAPDSITRIEYGDLVYRENGRLNTIPGPLRTERQGPL